MEGIERGAECQKALQLLPFKASRPVSSPLHAPQAQILRRAANAPAPKEGGMRLAIAASERRQLAT
jgi:hypothetical protein